MDLNRTAHRAAVSCSVFWVFQNRKSAASSVHSAVATSHKTNRLGLVESDSSTGLVWGQWSVVYILFSVKSLRAEPVPWGAVLSRMSRSLCIFH